MSWVCPNCSNTNDEGQEKCFVCGMDRPTRSIGTEPEDYKIVFSDMEAFSESIKYFFRKKPSVSMTAISEETPAEPPKPSKAISRAGEDKPGRKTRALSIGTPSSEFAKPWPEHKIKFDTATIKEKGYVRSEQKTMGGVNGYCFYKEDGSNQFIRVEMLLVQKMARKLT